MKALTVSTCVVKVTCGHKRLWDTPGGRDRAVLGVLLWGGTAVLKEAGFFHCEVKQLWLYKPPMCTAITKHSSVLRHELYNTHRGAGKETSSKVTNFPAAAELLRTSKRTGKR